LNLNGPWRFAFDRHNRGEHERWYRVVHPEVGHRAGGAKDPFGDTIVVPFPWESPLSGVHDTEYLGAGWYQRAITAPASWASDASPSAFGAPERDGNGPHSPERGSSTVAGVGWRLRPWLAFGAIDWEARVWIDGRLVAEHVGGYTPFEIDLSPFLTPGRQSTLTVRACDHNDASTPVGKQTRRWYTHSSGIWQTVHLEGRPTVHVVSARITTPLSPAPHATFAIEVNTGELASGDLVVVEVSSPDQLFSTAREVIVASGPEHPGARATVTVTPTDPQLWSPDHPHLYHAIITCQTQPAGDEAVESQFGSSTQVRDATNVAVQVDTVRTYFGLREVRTASWEDRALQVILLNGSPLYLRGALDQAFHPEGVHAYPSDDAIRADFRAAKDLGLNMLRCHIKVNDPRYYYWADVFGVAIFYDFPCTIVDTPASRRHWEATFRDALARDANHPSIIAWILFNETWGLERHEEADGWHWVESMFHLCKTLDPTRIVEDNSPCHYDHVISDINTWHFYITTWDAAREHVKRVVDRTYPGSGFNYVGGKYGGDASRYVQANAPLLNSEYAGLSARHGEKDIAHTFRYLTTDLRRHEAITGYVYTELTDVEWEHNGLVTYDRTAKVFGYDSAFPGMSPADVNGADVVGFDASPFEWAVPGTELALAAFVSHWADTPINGATLHWAIDVVDIDGHTHRDVAVASMPVQLRRYGVTNAGLVEISVPSVWPGGLLTVRLWLTDGAGNVRARNYTQRGIGAVPTTTRAVDGIAHAPVEIRPNAITWRPCPADYSDASWPDPRIAPDGQKLGAPGTGWVEYALAVPSDLNLSSDATLIVRFEAGSRSALQRRGWHDTRHFQPTDYPQTRPYGRASRIDVTVGGVSAGTVTAPDDYADARGIWSLSALPEWEYASAGTVLEVTLHGDPVRCALDHASDGVLRVRLTVPPGEAANGLNLYGAGRGGSPVPLTIQLNDGR
jgi:hypothetical protein